MMINPDFGTLYVVATPIGNLGDMVPRAVDVLQSVDLIAAEDTRHSVRLLQHYGISTRLVAYHDFSHRHRLEGLLENLQQGLSIALISDAGTPLISDPGYELVSSSRQQGIRVVPIPGACALIAALSVSGLPSNQFVFEGFLAAKSVARRKQLSAFVREHRTVIFYESPHRIMDTLVDMEGVLGVDRPVVLARELTKTYETIISGSVEEVITQLRLDANQQKGEFVVLLKGAPQRGEAEVSEATEQLMRVLMEELPLKQASSIAAKVTGLKKRELYQWGLEQSG